MPGWLDKVLSRAEEICVALLLCAASLILFIDVAGRFLFSTSFSWAAESVRYAIVWVVFIGSSIAARRGIHISIDALREFLPPPARRPLILLVLAISILFCALMLWFAIQLVATMQGYRQVSPAMQIPMWWVYLAIPVGVGLMLVRFAQTLWLELRYRLESLESDPAERELAG